MAFDQHHIRPAFFDEVVQRADTDHATTDHHHACMCFHVLSSQSLPDTR